MLRLSARAGAWLSCAVVLLALPTYGQVIDFETFPASQGGGTPTDDTLLTGSYTDGTTTVTFGYDTTGDGAIDNVPRFEARSPNGGCFSYICSQCTPDEDTEFVAPAVGGDFLIRPSRCAGEEPFADMAGGDPFLIVYSGTLPGSASGEIWDIDGNEIYLVEALDTGGTVIGTDNPPPGVDQFDPLDGEPYTFSFSALGSPIAKIRITRTDFGSPRGFGFDNFDATRPAGCGDNLVNKPNEECDGTADAACPGLCQNDCTCLDIGACCNKPNPAGSPPCTDDVSSANCGAPLQFFPGDTCAAVLADRRCEIVPAVSEWGLVVLTLIGLVAGMIVFGRRRPATA